VARCQEQTVRVLDLFSGMGGFSLGFAQAGFNVSGIDLNDHCLATYERNIGHCEKLDLSSEIPPMRAEVVIAGPPCRPWSRLNISRRREEHPDRPLVHSFEEAILALKPLLFVLENVPLLEKDELFQSIVGKAGSIGYRCHWLPISYSDFGAPTKRTRLFLFGAHRLAVLRLVKILQGKRCDPQKVGDVLLPYRLLERGAFPDHEWANIRTMWNYRKKYEAGRYGWYRLDKNAPAPSFGNIQKTYVLHPDSWDSLAPRVLSVREAMAIMGFPDDFTFPSGVPMTAKYRMVADAVSPTFSEKCAEAIKEFLGL
jgi:DNA (cytosine-5)-methyltransferase 1